MELREWQYMNKPAGSTASNSSSSGYKKRFEKLIKYHIDHASSELESITHKDIKEDSFHLSEHYNDGSNEFDRTIIVSVNKYTDEFYLSIFVDGKVVYRNEYEGYEKVLEILTGSYMFLPDEGTPDYDDLLTESLNEWQLMNPPKASQSASTASSKTNKEKFKGLLQYIVDHKDSDTLKVDVSKLDDTGFTYRELRVRPQQKYELATIVNYGYGKNNSSWQVSIYKSGKNIDVGTGEGWEKLLDFLEDYYNVPDVGTKEYKDLCESASSVADDFKAYENLWD
jgi:hypothetical protein